MLKRGFTIVELIIIITVIGILLTLSAVNLSGSQVNARNTERKNDIEVIAMHLENFYNSGTDDSQTIGRYPSREEMSDLPSQTRTLRDIDPRALLAPGQTGTSLIPQPNHNEINKNKYIYTPLDKDGNYCEHTSQECRKFFLYCQLETESQTIITVMSKNQ